ncbi:MAG TPA: protein kinase [Kofleriaceae bacterium]|nr:protein kinase [Kofleriaceae bacterium]
MIGTEVYGYRVERALSEDKGGFGEVYFARHTTSGAEAVLKVLKPEMSAHREIVTRFFNEARAAAAIQHPGIVLVHNVGYVQDRAYLLMERLRGEDLETRLKRGPIPVEQAIRFLRQAAGAIGAAHERNIVHRDLKPANLFLVPDPDVVGGERIKVLDFGIAKLGTGNTMMTQGVFGTPAYMSPEQCSSSADVDARSDLYSIGCIAFEMLAGRPPFGHGGLELVAAHLRDEPPPLRSVAPQAPPAFEALVSRLLKKRREERPASCAALIAALDDLARAPSQQVALAPTMPPPVAPISHPPPSTTLGNAVGARDSTAAPKKTPWGIIAAGIAVVVGGGAAAMIAMGGGGGSKNAATSAGAVVTIDAATPAPVAQIVIDAPVIAAAPTVAPIVEPPDARPSVKVPSASVEDLIATANRLAESGDCPRATESYEKALEQRPNSVEALTGIGDCELDAKRFAAANAKYKAALAVKPRYEPALWGVAESYRRQGRKNEAIAAYHAYLDAYPDAAKAKRVLAQLEPTTGPPKPPTTTPPSGDCDEVSCVLNNWEGACCDKYKKHTAAPTPTTGSSDLPESLDSGMIKDAVAKVKARIFACGAKYPSAQGTVKIHVKVDPDGAIVESTADTSPDPGLGSCAAAAMKGARFPKTQRGGSFKYPFDFAPTPDWMK